MTKLIAWIRNSKKAIIAAGGPFLTALIIDTAMRYEIEIPSVWVGIGVTFLLSLLFGVLTYAIRNIPPNVAGVISDIVDEATE